MAKKEKERSFNGEADFLRYYLRSLAEELGVVVKDTNLMKKEECKGKIKELYKRELKKEVDQETKATIESLKKELVDRNNQITALQKEKVELENAKNDYLKEIIVKTELIKIHEKELKETIKSNTEVLKEKYEKIESLENEIKELQGINTSSNQALKADAIKLSELEKEIEEKNGEIKELKAERNSSQLTLEKRDKELEKYKIHNIKLVEKIDDLLIEIKELKNRKWYDPFLFWK